MHVLVVDRLLLGSMCMDAHAQGVEPCMYHGPTQGPQPRSGLRSAPQPRPRRRNSKYDAGIQLPALLLTQGSNQGSHVHSPWGSHSTMDQQVPRPAAWIANYSQWGSAWPPSALLAPSCTASPFLCTLHIQSGAWAAQLCLGAAQQLTRPGAWLQHSKCPCPDGAHPRSKLPLTSGPPRLHLRPMRLSMPHARTAALVPPHLLKSRLSPLLSTCCCSSCIHLGPALSTTVELLN